MRIKGKPNKVRMPNLEKRRENAFRAIECAKDVMERICRQAHYLTPCEEYLILKLTSDLHEAMWFIARAKPIIPHKLGKGKRNGKAPE